MSKKKSAAIRGRITLLEDFRLPKWQHGDWRAYPPPPSPATRGRISILENLGVENGQMATHRDWVEIQPNGGNHKHTVENTTRRKYN